MRIGFLTSHPIQYQAPLFRRLSSSPGVDLEVLFCHDHGLRPTHDPGFGQTIRYDVSLTDGFCSRFLRNLAPRPGINFSGLLNPEITRDLTSGRFDALVVHGYANLTNLLALLGPRRSTTALLLRGENHLLEPRSAHKRLAKQMVLRGLFRRVDHFLAIGSLNQQYLRNYGVAPERITVAPYAIDNEFFASRAAAARNDPGAARRALGLPEDRPLFLFSGKLIPAKRPLDAVRALAVARRQAPCALVLVGDGVLRPQVEAEARALGVAGDVFLLGFRNQSELPALYGACDALVLPSEREPWGLVVNEAMACGMAIAASDRVGATADLVAENGVVLPVGDTEALGRALGRWAADPQELARRRASSLERIASWGIDQTADGVLRGCAAAVKGLT